jgi:hypothetical protein
VIASAKVSDRLALLSDGPRLERKQWRVKPCLVPEFEPVLDRIRELAVGGLTSMHLLEDFLKRRVMPLQGRPCLCCWFTSPSDIGRIQHGPGTDLTWEQLEILVRGITDEAFIPESLIPPQGISPLCDNPGLRSAVLARLLTLNESGVAVHQTGGRDPHQGIHIPGAPVGGSQPVDVAPRVPPAVPNPSDKGKGPASSSSTPDAARRSEEVRRHRLRRSNGSFVSDLPRDSGSPQKHQKTAGRTKEAEPRVQDRQRGASPPPPPSSDHIPPPLPVSDRPPSPRGQRQQQQQGRQQQQQRQRAPRFQGHWKVHGPK